MDGDNTAKTFEQGANSAVRENEMTSGLHESVKQTVGPRRSALTCSTAKTYTASCRREDTGDRYQHIRQTGGCGLNVQW